MGSDGETSGDTEELAIRFMKVYNNLPLQEREQTVLVLGEEPISHWATKEHSTEPERGGKIK